MDLSIIIPCYNEGEKMVANTKKIIEFMKPLKATYEIIVVNDGSTDNTSDYLWKILKKYSFNKQEDNLKNFRCITYKENKGKGYAVKQGIRVSKGKYVLFMDADLSTDLKAIYEVLSHKNMDVIIGSRKIKGANLVKKQGFVRKFVGNCCRVLTNIIVPLHIIDTQCGFKAFEGNFAREMIKKQTVHRFAFDVEYLYIAKLNKKAIMEIPVTWENDEDSKVSVINTSIDFFKCLFKIRKNKKNYIINK